MLIETEPKCGFSVDPEIERLGEKAPLINLKLTVTTLTSVETEIKYASEETSHNFVFTHFLHHHVNIRTLLTQF